MADRRQFLKRSGAALVAGLHAGGRRGSVAAAAPGAPSFDDVPALDGTLLLDEASCTAAATDPGNIVRRRPRAVLRPGSAADVSRMIGYCRRHDIRVAASGQDQATHGQGLTDGLLVDVASLDRIRSVGPHGAVVDAGVTWKSVILAACEKGLTPPAFPGSIGLTVGGTLAMGGVGGLRGRTGAGLPVDHVRQVEVVTGKGEVLTCSGGRNPDLFEAVLGGLGQCGVITKATLDLVPSKPRARTCFFRYTDPATFFADLRVLLERPGLDHVVGRCFPPGTARPYELRATRFYDLPGRPDDAALTGGLGTPPSGEQDLAYVEFVGQADRTVDALRATVDRDRMIKPWFDVWLPGSAVEAFVSEVLPTLTPRDVGPGGLILLSPQKRSRLTRPFLRVPEPDGSDWIFLFDLLTVAPRAGPDPAFTAEMMARNHRLFARAREAFGGVRHPVGSLDFSPEDWRRHYGDRWEALVARKHRFDPAHLLTPGPGIFV